MFKELYNILWHSSIFSEAITFGLGCILYKSLKDYLKILLGIVTVGLIVDIVNTILTYKKINNYFIFHYYTIIEFILWILFYYVFYREVNKKYFLIFALIPIFLIVCYTDYKMNGLSSMDNFSSSLESLILTLFSLISFKELMNKNVTINFLKNPFFIVNSGILLYFLGNLCFFTFSNYFCSNSGQDYMAPWGLHSILNTTFNILICTSFWTARVI